MLFLSICVFSFVLKPVSGGLAAEEKFKVYQGESLQSIGKRLFSLGFIRSSFAFSLYSIIMNDSHRIQPGVFALSTSMGVSEILSRITSPYYNSVRVTIYEGITQRDIQHLLDSSEIGDSRLASSETALFTPSSELAREFPFLASRSSLEGFLFPDTYLLHASAQPAEAYRVMLEAFRDKAWPLLSERDDAYDVLSIASILEREVRSYEDRQIVAGILYKRLSANMPLQVDASVIYATCGARFFSCNSPYMRRSDVDFDSPYNTYLHSGLPPTPISNPGLVSIKAALNPRRTPYWFYLSDAKTGRTIFSETFDEHNMKRARHLLGSGGGSGG